MSRPDLQNLPLFPLARVLFPYIPLQLKVFEQRYLSMISNVFREQGAFGIVPITSGHEVGAAPEIYSCGTLVTICDWEQLSGGLLGITVMGEQRFYIEESAVDQQQLMRAEVRLFVEEREQRPDTGHEDLISLLNTLTDHPLSQHLKVENDMSLYQLSWLLAELLPLDREVQLKLLATEDNNKRIAFISDTLDKLMV